MHKPENNYSNLFNTYNRLAIKISHGNGVYLFDESGNKYLDFFGGLAVNSLGYSDPDVIKAITEQAQKYIHLSNYFLQQPQSLLAELLTKHTGYKKVFFSNSGTEAIEGAIKLVRKWGSDCGKTEIVSFSNSFHGRTMGSLSLMDRKKYKDGFEPFLPNCRIISFNDIDDLRKSINNKTVAVFLEFLQGEAGVIPASEEFINTLRELKAEFGFLIVADEIQSGIGRTGKLFYFNYYDINPDLVVIAKALGGGLPLGAILGNQNVSGVLTPGSHGSTFGGNPVACSAGTVVLDKVIENGLIRNAGIVGDYLFNQLLNLQQKYPQIIREIRGKGLMIGIELSCNCSKVVDSLLKKGILVNCTNTNVIRLLPPLIIGKHEVDLLCHSLESHFSISAE
ncbi:MAG: aspartate aminotransferase family protein [Ignavibacteriales bacterium]|nr:aspartate aminotransferase family protein [Ignavibacteriales bacterium]